MTKKGRQLLLGGRSAPPEKILAMSMRKGPRLTLVWGPEWLIRPWF